VAALVGNGWVNRPDEVIIITDEGCDPCLELKKLLEGTPAVRFLDLISEEADQLLGDLEQVVVPLPIARFGEERKVCELAQNGQQVLLVCADERIPLKE